MRMEIGMSTNTVKFYDDADNEVIIPCQRIKMDLGVNEMTTLDLLGVYMDKITVVAQDDKVTITP